jgi:endonuclease YncB( thermonuclease family)
MAALCDVSGRHSVQATDLEGEEMSDELPPEIEAKLPPLGWSANGIVLKVGDGDTLRVRVFRDFEVRLLNCWCPETKLDKRLPPEKRAEAKAAGIRAALHLDELAANQRVRVRILGSADGDFRESTSMKRVLGDVYRLKDGLNLAEAMVTAGHATKEEPK